MVYEVNIAGEIPQLDINGSPTISNTTNSFWVGDNTTWPTYNWPTYWTNIVYIDRYQIRCPRKGCRRYNWLELDKITPCVNCGSELKAVSKKADFEIEVD